TETPLKRQPAPAREATTHPAERPVLIFIFHRGAKPPWQLLAIQESGRFRRDGAFWHNWRLSAA
ncbi:hypothetical protein, partial [Mycobacterium noviomagense]